MATILSNFVTRKANTVSADCAGDVVANQFYVDLKAADLVAGNLIDLGILPAGHTVINAVLVPEDLDTNAAPTITLDVGIMSGVPGDGVSVRTVGTELFAASTAAQTGTPAAISQKSAYTIAAADFHRSIGAKIVAGPATAAATGRLRLLVTSAPVNSGFQF